MALLERKRIDGPPRGGAVKIGDTRVDPNLVTREDIEAIIGMGRPLFSEHGSNPFYFHVPKLWSTLFKADLLQFDLDDDVSEARLLPEYERLRWLSHRVLETRSLIG